MQDLDSRIDTLTRQLASIPEARRLKELGLLHTQLDNGLRDLRIRVEDLTAEQKRADADVEQVKARRVRDQDMVDSGQIGDPRALEHMLDELRSLNRRISDLEDVELEVMEQLENTQHELDEQVLALQALDEERTRVQQQLDETTSGLQSELAEVTGRAGRDRHRHARGPDVALRQAPRAEGRRRRRRAAAARVHGLPPHPERLRPRRGRQGPGRRGAALRGLQPDPDPDLGVGSPVTRSVVVEADGGSRGNPGPAAYGALLKDADTGELIAERGETIGRATNNVAEYRGLIAGLELAAEYAPDADIEVRMDSKLVVEQMSGNWKIKHPSMRPLAVEANRLAPIGTTFTWVPRAQNAHADRLANEALDGLRDASGLKQEAAAPPPAPEAAAPPPRPTRGWGPPGGKPTTFVLVRHGVTDATSLRLFSGGLSSSNPGLNDEGREQARETGEWLAPMAGTFDALVTSPVRRTRETAEILSEFLDLEVLEEPALAEMEFGTWDGMSFTDVHEKWPDELSAWLGDLDSAPHGGESFREVEKRVLEGKDRLMSSYEGQTVVVVSHVTPIKTLVAEALGAPLESVYRMELAPASVSVISYFTVGPENDIPMSSMRLYNGRPTDVFG